ncbi:zinc ribbon domain-containing protein [Luteitalea pratensis]|uniref:zinc ribbon domain-containing protein n=1 Tax=Luteitalea pratensis TaxID=1855912 RepID=UPI000D73DE50
MLVCGCCGGHFEAYTTSWKPEPVYVCATRRRKPGVCTNKAAIPIFDADNIMLDMVEDEVLSPAYVDTLLAMMARGTDPAETPRLERERERLETEVQRLVGSIAHGVDPREVADQIAVRRACIEAATKRLASVQEPPDVDRLRDALLQRCAEWREVLRGEVHVARILLRKLVGPIFLEDPLSPEQALAVGVVSACDSGSEEDLIRWDAPIKPGILEGLATVQDVASPTGFEPVFQP